MIKHFLTWLISIYFKPAQAETQTPEVSAMSDQPVIVPEIIVDTTLSAEQPAPTPAAEVKAGVADFEAALTFVESGVAQLGEAAKDELKELAKKYL